MICSKKFQFPTGQILVYLYQSAIFVLHPSFQFALLRAQYGSWPDGCEDMSYKFLNFLDWSRWKLKRKKLDGVRVLIHKVTWMIWLIPSFNFCFPRRKKDFPFPLLPWIISIATFKPWSPQNHRPIKMFVASENGVRWVVWFCEDEKSLIIDIKSQKDLIDSLDT